MASLPWDISCVCQHQSSCTAAILSKARCMVSPDVNVRRRLNLICIPLGSASVSRVFTRRSVTQEQRLRSFSAINKNVEHNLQMLTVLLKWQKCNKDVHSIAVFTPFPQQWQNAMILQPDVEGNEKSLFCLTFNPSWKSTRRELT